MNPVAVLEELARQGVQARSLCVDSRRVRSGDVFLAYPGAVSDGRDFVADAVAKGAAAVLYEAGSDVLPDLTVPVVAVPGLAALAGAIAHQVYCRPSEHLWLIGVTGTNGKTSISQWIAQALDWLEQPCAVIGTLGNGFLGHFDPSPNTTPDAVTLHEALADFVAHGAAACAMEVSSIGLDQHRIAGARIRTAVFTNLTRDHLEYHGTMEAYGAAKARLFEQPGLESAVINLDDEFGAALARRQAGRLRLIGYSLDAERVMDGGDLLIARGIVTTPAGMAFTVENQRVAVGIVGRFNVSNLLAVYGVLRSAGITPAAAAEALARLRPPPGRMELHGGERQPLVVVDYAHTPDALDKALSTLRETATGRGGRLLCVFGCGGDRDPGKRAEMGRVAEHLADAVILTNDNPRGEDPARILAAIAAGMARAPRMEPDRAHAIASTVAAAGINDVVLIAGKGHETYQEIDDRKLPFSDAAETERALEEWTC
ncbi:MAG: UDP-N-acetylmuramoyl-L-alanyl-D-glutamate--2,6-diaminopimelate ligase [Proteobacteria bacterium]|nr:UDP-N-acetylmuramoyl-L-alanyl-D-glutamate--2,6-diaminopimelate ligase [Pseudomonadota bacterium]HQR04372.1 UDP-N-acetylmuramoyl-L-alanyl-D-glutamate--2,6-diaminopimelate ligase [Rhodocyclaceae bacterium]